MKISVQKNKLQKGIGFVERITSKNTTLPILSNILLKTESGRLCISATNLEIGISSLIGAKIEINGQIAVPGRILADFIKAAEGDVINIKTNQNTLLVDTNTYKTSILGFDASEYPIIPKIQKTEPFIISVDILRRMFNIVSDSIATSESRPELSGAFLRFKTSETIIAATDSFRLVEQRINLKNSKEAAVIIPRGVIVELIRILGEVGGDVSILIGDNQIEFIHDDFSVISRLIDGKYPDYFKVIPEHSLSRALIHKTELENAIKIAALFSSSISDINIYCEESVLRVTAKNSSKGEVSADIPVNLKGDPFEISLNYHYFLDGLKIIATDKVVMEFTGKGSPFVLRPNNDKKEEVYVIMPLRS